MDISALFSSSNSSLNNLISQEHTKTSLKALLAIIDSCIGPAGKLKVIQNISGGHATITSCSQRLYNVLTVQDTVAKIVVTTAKSQVRMFGDSGLHCALVTLKLLTRIGNYNLPLPMSLPVTCGSNVSPPMSCDSNTPLPMTCDHYVPLPTMCSSSIPPPVAGALTERIGALYVKCLGECCFTVDVGNLGAMRSVVRSVLGSKPGCLLVKAGREFLVALLLRAFLSAVPKGSVRLVTSEGPGVMESRVFGGLLLPVSETELKGLKTGAVKVALFTCPISGGINLPIQDFSAKDENFELALQNEVVNKLLAAEVVFCQKVIHPNIQKRLRDAGIMVFDRLGAENTKYLQFILGIPANSSPVCDVTLATLNILGLEEVGRKSFVRLQSSESSLHTVVLCGRNEECLAELKVVCDEVINTLFRIVASPEVYFGGGCSELRAVHLLKENIKTCEDDIMQEVGCSFGQLEGVLKDFISCAACPSSSLDYITESQHGHLWKKNGDNYPSGENHCNCGLYSAANLDSWIALSDILSEGTVLEAEDNKSLENIVLDEFSSRKNSFTLAFETASLLLRTTLCISKLPENFQMQAKNV